MTIFTHTLPRRPRQSIPIGSLSLCMKFLANGCVRASVKRIILFMSLLLISFTEFIGILHADNTNTDSYILHDFDAQASIPLQCCVGAVGPMCGELLATGTKCGDAPGGIKSVSVGSILHDNCCILNYPDGYNCNNGGNNNVCKDEFNKAVKNFKKREWKAYFSGDPDNISPVPARISNPMHFQETVATSRLSAPAGTKLNKTDADYCQSKSFIEAQEQLAKQNFGTCGGDPWIGEWVQVNFLTIYDDGVWGEDILSGIGFVAKIRATKWKETDEHGEGCAVTFSYTLNNEKVYSKQAIKLGERCPPLPLPLLYETGKLEFSKNNLFMFEYFDLQPGDEIAAFKWRRR
jgi:hypothetical protein